AHHNVVPLGAIGEIYIGGPGISPGYLNRPDNATKFITNPFGKGTLYATGDLGRWLSNGEVECLGRIDDQVKVRGYRIELEELIGYVAPQDIDVQAIIAFVKAYLPHHMVPAVIVPFDALPLTHIGKIDRKALPRVDFDKLHSQDIVPPQTPMETTLVGILATVLTLNNDQISARSTFFQLAGNSLAAIRLVAKCRQQGFALAMADINRTDTIAQLAQRMES
ncbi:hypothetical protein H4R35_004337, partial [Dimargaris xerosporica]